MPKRLIGLILIITGIIAFHLFGTQPETRAIWQNNVTDKIYLDPVAVGDHFVFLAGDKGKREFKLIQIDSQGKVTAQSTALNNLPFDPVAFDNMVVVGDRAKMVRGFSVPGLNIEWESGTAQAFPMGPIKLGKDNFLIQSDQSLLFCLDNKTGKPVWDKTFTDNLINYGADKAVICIHGHADTKNPVWKASGLDPADGLTLWTLEQKLSSDSPLFVQDICILTNTDGQVLVVDQMTGQVLYQHPVDGLKAIQILDDTLIMLASGGSRLVCMSLMTGNSWTTTLQSGFTGAAKYGNRLLISDKKNLRCLDATSGVLIWNRNLEDIYNAFPFRNGIFITHKDSFFARETFGSYIETATSESLWLAYDRSIFSKPLATSHGDLLLSYGGNFRMMGKAKSTGPAVIEIDPTQNINFWKNKTASETAKPADTTVTPKPEDKKPDTGIDPADEGWGSKD